MNNELCYRTVNFYRKTADFLTKRVNWLGFQHKFLKGEMAKIEYPYSSLGTSS